MRLDLNVTVTVSPIVVVLRNETAREEADQIAADLKAKTDELSASLAAADTPKR